MWLAALDDFRNCLIPEAFRGASTQFASFIREGRRIRLLLRAPFLNPLEVFDERLDPRLDRLFRGSEM